MFQRKFRRREFLVAVGGGLLLGFILATSLFPFPPIVEQMMVCGVLTGYMLFILIWSVLMTTRPQPVLPTKPERVRFKRYPFS